MRIGVNTLFLLPGEVGGSETYVVETVGALLRDAPDVTVVLLTAREGHAALFPRFGNHPRVEFQPLEFAAANRPRRILHEQIALPRLARRARLDVLWSLGYTGPLQCPCPHVLTILDVQYRRFPESLRPTYRWASNFLIRAGVRRAACVLTLSEFSRQEILRFTRAPPAGAHLVTDGPPNVGGVPSGGGDFSGGGAVSRRRRSSSSASSRVSAAIRSCAPLSATQR